MGGYDRQFLAARGYFERERRASATVEGRAIEFAVDPDARLAYVEGVDPEVRRAIVSDRLTLDLDQRVDFYWFWNPDTERVAVYNRYGEPAWFVHDRSSGRPSDLHAAATRKLEAIDDGVGTLFDDRHVVDRLYRNLWDHRLELARSFEVPGNAALDDDERLVAAQRAIDRLLCWYFLVELNVIHGVDDDGTRFELSPETVFDAALDTGAFYDVLTETVFDHLRTPGWTVRPVTDAVSIAVPYLGVDPVPPRRLSTADGGALDERALDATSYDWAALVDELNAYSWTVERAPPTDETGGAPTALTSAVLGHVFERFAVTVSELSGEDALSLDELEALDAAAGGGELLEGNRRIGAYYTPTYIAYENARETLWNRVRALLAAEYDVPEASIPDPDRFFAALAADESTLPVDRQQVDDVLADVTVLDPAVGSGAFLLTAGDLLERWRCRLNGERSRAALRREIVCDSLYGVDLLEGAVEVCRLRLWLWLLGATAVDLDDGEPAVEALPSLEFTVRRGNSLVGVANPSPASLADRLEVTWTDGEAKPPRDAIEAYRATVAEYRAMDGADPALEARLTAQQRRLQDAFTAMLARESDATVTEVVASTEAVASVVDGVDGRVKCTLDFDSPMGDEERTRVAEAGFREQRNWPTTAYHRDVRDVDPDALAELFDLLDDRGTVSLERPVRPADVESLAPVHWPLAFPTVEVPEADGEGAFDVVIGNPPHGSSVGDLERALLEERYTLTRGGCDVAKLFLERSWALTRGELSYVVPKASTYNTNWEDVRSFCLETLHRGVDLGTAFRNVDHEQVTIHLSRTAAADRYECGPLPDGASRLEGTATVDRSFADALGTLPVSFTANHRTVAAGLEAGAFPTLGELGIDAGRGAQTGARIDDPAAPIAYNGRQVQPYFTRAPTDRVETAALSNATRRRVETPKVIAQNIIAHRTRPYDHLRIAAAYDPIGTYTFETVTNVVVPADAALSPPALAVLLNSQFINWFVSVSIFNRAIRDMHLDACFLERLILPPDLTTPDRSTLDALYGLLAVAGVAVEYELDPRARDTSRELQSVANALIYDLYFRDAAETPLETDLVSRVAAELEGHDVAYREWYRSHLACPSETAIAAAFPASLFETATAVAAAFRRGPVASELEAVASHPWVEIIERGRHRAGDRPVFGPFETR